MTDKEYFTLRDVSPCYYENYRMPGYLQRVLLENNPSRILDFGCGYGQLMSAIKRTTSCEVEGIDVDGGAIDKCRNMGFICHDAADADNFFAKNKESFDLVIMSHVLEHIPKSEMIRMLSKIREILNPTGQLLLAVPNAQASTGAYWRYEDFTHTYLFTSGSVKYVLRAAGYRDINIIDIDCTEGLPMVKRIVRKSLLAVYAANYKLWSKVTASPIHSPSPSVFSYEIKVVAR